MKAPLALVALIALSSGSCKERETAATRDLPAFLVMNVTVPEEFSFPSYYMLKDLNGNPCPPDSIFREPRLVLRFSEYHDDTRVQAEVDLINRSATRDHVIGIASYGTPRVLRIIKEKLGISFPLYMLPFGDAATIFPASMEERALPYLFLVDSRLRARHVFFPSTRFPDVSVKYHAEISRVLLDAMFDEKTIDLGTIPNHQPQEIKFKYTNRFSSALTINDVKTSCECTVPRWDSEPLETNRSAELTVLFTPETPGYNAQTILVSHDRSKHPARLQIRANVAE